MKTLWLGFNLIVLAHLLVLIAGIGWLAATDRLNEDRIRQVIDTFSITTAEEAKQVAEAQRLEEEARKLAEDTARLQAVSAGPVSLSDRLAIGQTSDELAMHRLERLQNETSALRDQINRLKSLLSREKTKLADERAAFEKYKQDLAEATANEGFEQAVTMTEALDPKQVKSIIELKQREGKIDEMVDIIAAMQPRKASGVLREFKTPQDIPTLTDLLTRLRDRGVDPETLADAAAENGVTF